MVDGTPVYGWPFPDSADPPDVPSDVQDLAEAIESEVARLDAGFRYSETVTYTSSGSFVKGDFPGLRAVIARCQAGGGGGGGTNATGSGQAGVSGGGAGGEYRAAFVLEGDMPSSVTVTVGTGGTGGADHTDAGSPGGQSMFGTFVVAQGGSGGASNNVGVGTLISSGGNGGTGGTGGFDRQAGGDGTNGYRFDGNVAMAGHGGNSRMAGTKRPSGATAGTNDTGPDFANGHYPGGGGGGGYNNQNQAAVARGGHGADGIVLVDIYV